MINSPVLALTSTTAATSLTGNAIYVAPAVAASFVAVFVDTGASGTIKIQASNAASKGDPQTFVPPITSWADIPNATSTIATGVGPAILLNAMCYQYIRVIFTRTAGSATAVNVYMSRLAVA